MSATDVRRVVEHNAQEVQSLVHVLSTLAAYWRLCECGLEIGRDGKDGWQQKCECLESELYPLQGKIERLEKLNKVTTDPQQLMQQETELAELRAELSLLSTDIQAKEAPIDAEWEQAHNETDAYRELFEDACEFCVKERGIGDIEVFNAALVGFNPSRLRLGQEPSKQRMSEIVSLLRNLQRHVWETQPWANPTKPTMRARRRVTRERLNLFNVRNLKESIADPILRPTTSVKAGGKDGKVDAESGLTTTPNAETLAMRNEVESGADAVVVPPTGKPAEPESAVGMQAVESEELFKPIKPSKYASKDTPIPKEYKDTNGKPIGPLQGNETELSKAIGQNRKAKPIYLQSRHLKRLFIHEIGHQDFHVYFMNQSDLDRASKELVKVRAKEPPYDGHATPSNSKRLQATPNDSK